MPDALTPVEAARERAAIFDPILIYTDAIDSKQFERLADAFHPDASLDYGEGYAGQSLRVIITWMTDAHAKLIGSQHRLTNFFIDQVADGTAKIRTYVDAILIGGPPAAPLTYRDVGTYHDQLVLDGERWLIVSREYKRLLREGDIEALRAAMKRS